MTTQQEAIAEMIEAIKKVATAEQLEQRVERWADASETLQSYEMALLYACAALGACMAHQSCVLEGGN